MNECIAKLHPDLLSTDSYGPSMVDMSALTHYGFLLGPPVLLFSAGCPQTLSPHVAVLPSQSHFLWS